MHRDYLRDWCLSVSVDSQGVRSDQLPGVVSCFKQKKPVVRPWRKPPGLIAGTGDELAWATFRDYGCVYARVGVLPGGSNRCGR